MRPRSPTGLEQSQIPGTETPSWAMLRENPPALMRSGCCSWDGGPLITAIPDEANSPDQEMRMEIVMISGSEHGQEQP